MKIRHLFRLILLSWMFLGLNNNLLQGQWTQTTPPDKTNFGYYVQSFFQYGRFNFVATSSGLYVSENVREPWINVRMTGFNTFGIAGDTLFYGPHAWALSVLNLKSLNLDPVTGPARNPDYQNIIYDKGRFFWYHMYGGFTELFPKIDDFTYHNQGLPKEKLWDHTGYIIIQPVSAVTKCGKWFICSTWQGLYKCDSPLFIWTQAGHESATFKRSKLFSADQELFTIKDSTLYSSMDFGETWTDLSFGYSDQITCIVKYESLLLIGTSSSGILARKDGETTWKRMNNGLIGSNVNFIKHADSILVCGTATGGFHYLNPEGNWVCNNSGLHYFTEPYRIKSHGNKLFTWTSGKLFSTDDEGDTWKNIPFINNSNLSLQNSVSIGTKLFFLLYRDSKIQAIIYTENNGTTWTDISQNMPRDAFDDSYYMQMHAFGNRLVITQGSNRRIFYSDDFGLTWCDVSFSNQYCNGISGITEYNGTLFIAFCNDNQVARLVNNQWVLCNRGLYSNQSPGSLFVCNDQLYHQTGWDWHIYNAKDDFWQTIPNGISNETYGNFKHFGNVDCAFNQYNDWVFSNSCFADIQFLNTDGLPLSNGYGGMGQLELVNNTLFTIRDNNGIWKRPLSQITSVHEDEILPEEIKVFPNPASHFFTISGIPIYQTITVTLIDISGRRLFTTQSYPGQRIDIPYLNTGIYLVQIRNGSESIFNRLIIK
jgi:photosystem II stability/assembly factor-like uncharacterized protein